MSDSGAKIDTSGNIEFENLNTDQLLIILNNKMSQLSEQVSVLQARVDERLVEMATKDDLQRFGQRMARLERRLDEQTEWINERKMAINADEQSFGAKFRRKVSDYSVIALIALLVAAVIGGVSYYVSSVDEIDKLRKQIEQVQALE